MKELDYTQLTLYQEDSPASPSPKQESTKEPTMTVTSGLKCLESYEKSSPLGSLVKMCLGSSVWHSTRCNLIWKKKVTKSNLSLFQLAVSMPRTKEKDASFWPTICANGMGSTGHQQMLALLVKTGIMTEEERRGMICGYGGRINPEWAEWLMGYEEQFTKLIPTPTATDWKGGCSTRYWRPRSQFVHVERERETGLRRTTEEFGGGHSPWEDWPDEPGVGRVAYGVPNRVDRIKCLGNAVVPEMFYPIFTWIKEIEDGEGNRDPEPHTG